MSGDQRPDGRPGPAPGGPAGPRPGGPPSPGPSGPGSPAPPPPSPPADLAAVLDETARSLRAAVARLNLPARRSLPPGAAAGGPARTTDGSSGGEPAPGPFAHGGASGRLAGAGSAEDEGGEGGSFETPQPLGPPRFGEGRHRLYGAARPRT